MLTGARHKLRAALEAVEGSDEDRILRAVWNALAATLRTNAYQTNAAGQSKEYLSFKIESQKLRELPLPKPLYEIFVFSPRMEGVHLRMGRGRARRHPLVGPARGLPHRNPRAHEGAKRQEHRDRAGGRQGRLRPEAHAVESREAQQAEVDRLLPDADPRPARPHRQHRRGQGRRARRGDPARRRRRRISWSPPTRARPPFRTSRTRSRPNTASGSATRSHRAARSAMTTRRWRSPRAAPGSASSGTFARSASTSSASTFTVAGIGDMAGDVFGNGMLQSPQIRLVAAFNHQHIFIDPQPDAGALGAGARRLFELPRSSWDDYSRKAISRGGGVYRAQRSRALTLSREAQALLGLPAQATPNEVIKAILKCRSTCCGTAASAPTSRRATRATATSATAATTRCAIDASELRCKVVGEGGNLGFSQRGRIEYRTARRPHQHRLHRQLRRRELLRRRGQFEDPAERRGPRQANSRAQLATSCSCR